MLNMLKFEFRRLTRKPSFYIMLGLCVGVAVFMVFSIRGSMNYMITHMNDLDSYYNESYVKEYFEKQLSPQMLALNEFWMVLPTVLAVFVGIFVCEDRARGTIKNIYARGYSRTSVYLAKFLLSSASAALLYLLVVAFVYLSGMIVFSTAPFEVQQQKVSGFLLLVLGRLLVILAVNSGYFMISELIGNTGFSIAANMFAPSIVTGILYVGLNIVLLIIFGEDNSQMYDVMQSISEYWIYSLAVSGFYVEMKVDTYMGHLMACLGYFILFSFLGWLISRKQQVKN